MDLKKMVI